MQKGRALRETFVIGDGDLVLLSGAFVNCRHVHDAVSVDVKSHLNLRNPSRSWRNPSQIKFSQKVVVFGHGPFPLKHLKT